MPSPEQLDQLATLFEQYQKGLLSRIAAAQPGDPTAEQLGKLHAMLTDSFPGLMAGSKEHNQRVGTAFKQAEATLNDCHAKLAEKLKNRPKPRPRVKKPKVVADPYLEEKLQLALHTPFGNRTPNAK